MNGVEIKAGLNIFICSIMPWTTSLFAEARSAPQTNLRRKRLSEMHFKKPIGMFPIAMNTHPHTSKYPSG